MLHLKIFTKFLFVVISFISIIVINFSCSTDKKGGNNSPASNNSGTLQGNQQNPRALTAQNDKPVTSSKYEFPGDNGIGPIKELSLGVIDQNLVSQGFKIFNMECLSCHQLDSRNVGPPLRNITKKNTPIYIMNYLLNTTEMQRKDSLMQKLVSEYKIIMPDQQLTRDDARAVLEYLRSVEK
jgi:hypothetical protein